jgi:hypothetical protein
LWIHKTGIVVGARHPVDEPILQLHCRDEPDDAMQRERERTSSRLTPLTAPPLIEKYVDYEIFAFVAANGSTGSVTMTVVPRKGTLATLKAYKTNGSAQAGNTDIVAGSLYFAIYNDALDSGSGGFVIK